MDGEISGPELKEALGSTDLLIVDIRAPSQFEQRHIEGSVNVPMSELPQQIDRVSDADHVVTVCPHGQASIRAARLIQSFEGFEGRVESLSGGLAGWDGPVGGQAAESDQDRTQKSQDTPF